MGGGAFAPVQACVSHVDIPRQVRYLTLTFALAAQPDFFLEDVRVDMGGAGERVSERGCRAVGLQILRSVNYADLE